MRPRSRPRRGPVRHVYVDDPEWEGYCLGCHLPERNAIHDVPERTDEDREHEQRRTGER